MKAVDLGRVCQHCVSTLVLSLPPLLSPQTAVHYFWIPYIIYLGYTRSNPQPSLIKYALRLTDSPYHLTKTVP